MKLVLTRIFGRVTEFASAQPVLALFLGASLLAVFVALLAGRARSEPRPGLMAEFYDGLGRFTLAAVVVMVVGIAFSLLRAYLHQTVATFQHNHGRITEANYNAVQTIWGAEQEQRELKMEIFYDEETVDRIESEDLTRPAVLRKKTVRHRITTNPFLSARHEVTLRQNARRKGSALYGGYETACRFHWQLKNPNGQELKSRLIFPLPAARGMYDDLVATLNGKDVLGQVQMSDGSLVLPHDLKPDELLDFTVAFKSRGMSSWYFQVIEAREIRDFLLTLTLPDLPATRLNYPEGCMSPTDIKATADGRGAILNYRLDHALSSKGMGISLPTLPQPGAVTSAVLNEAERAWMLMFALVLLAMTLANCSQAIVIAVLYGTAVAFAYGLLGDLSDLLFGFWGTALLVLVPLFLSGLWLLRGVAPRCGGKFLLAQLLLFGLGYPVAAGLDPNRQTLYFNLCAMIFLGFAASQLMKRIRIESVAPSKTAQA
jgi:hypothetical protein